jgi:hypothetical protein
VAPVAGFFATAPLDATGLAVASLAVAGLALAGLYATGVMGVLLTAAAAVAGLAGALFRAGAGLVP